MILTVLTGPPGTDKTKTILPRTAATYCVEKGFARRATQFEWFNRRRTD